MNNPNLIISGFGEAQKARKTPRLFAPLTPNMPNMYERYDLCVGVAICSCGRELHTHDPNHGGLCRDCKKERECHEKAQKTFGKSALDVMRDALHKCGEAIQRQATRGDAGSIQATSKSSRVGQKMKLSEMGIGATWKDENAIYTWTTLKAYSPPAKSGWMTDLLCSNGHVAINNPTTDRVAILLSEPVVEVGDKVESKFGNFTVTSIDERDVLRGNNGPHMKYKCQRDEIVTIIEKGARKP